MNASKPTRNGNHHIQYFFKNRPIGFRILASNGSS
jgi:hypothetical protein